MTFVDNSGSVPIDPDRHLLKTEALLAEAEQWRGNNAESPADPDRLGQHRALLDAARLHLDIAVAVRPRFAPAQSASQEQDASVYHRQGQRWEDQEEEQLLELSAEGHSIDEIGVILGRKPNGIVARLNKLYPGGLRVAPAAHD